MSKKKWLLVILLILLLAGYWKFYYKTWSETTVVKSADCIIALDIKRITNTIIWNTITTPSQWKKISFSSKEKFDWRDMVKTPDYVFIFHSANQPGNAWYTLLDIKDSADFEKGLVYYHFTKGETLESGQEYSSNEIGIELIKVPGKILVGNNTVTDKNYIRQVARELFVQKQFIARKQLFKNIEASSHLSVQLAKNNFLQEDGIIMANFDKKKIEVESLLTPRPSFSFAEHNFSYNKDALFSAGFTQPPVPGYALIAASTKEKISRAVNFNIDSLFLAGNQYYGINVASISPRMDSAITYTYDNNFNQAEKVVVNNVLEPSFDFSAHGDSVINVFNYWIRNKQLEPSDTGNLFLPMPFVKSYGKMASSKELCITSIIPPAPGGNSINCIFFLALSLTKIPAELLKYLPAGLVKSIANLEGIEVYVRKNEGKIKLDAKINKKKNDLPLADL